MTDDDNLSPLKAARRDKILDEAEALFVAQGFRTATMEGLAEAVRMSKVTVYGYFKDKDAVFAAVADRVATRLEDAVVKALDADGKATVRIAEALVAKHTIIFDLVRASPFAKDLFSTNARLSEDRFAQLDRAIIARLSGTLAADGRSEDVAMRLAKLLFHASLGIANAAPDRQDMARDVSTLVHALCGSEQAG
jgi:AcrR family transcriptional regulator